MDMKIASPAFADGGEIPRQYTCDGVDLSPPLHWEEVPAGTRSLVLIVDDPDAPDPAAPQMTWVHWVVYNIPPSVAGLPEGADAASLPPGARQGLNDWKREGWGGPCPPGSGHQEQGAAGHGRSRAGRSRAGGDVSALKFVQGRFFNAKAQRREGRKEKLTKT